MALLLTVIVTALLFQNCGKPNSGGSGGDLDLTSQAGLENASIGILQKNCLECHNSVNRSGNVGEITNVDALLYSRLVVPGEPELSPIIIEINTGRMPLGRPGLTGSDVEILKKWIQTMAY